MKKNNFEDFYEDRKNKTEPMQQKNKTMKDWKVKNSKVFDKTQERRYFKTKSPRKISKHEEL